MPTFGYTVDPTAPKTQALKDLIAAASDRQYFDPAILDDPAVGIATWTDATATVCMALAYRIDTRADGGKDLFIVGLNGTTRRNVDWTDILYEALTEQFVDQGGYDRVIFEIESYAMSRKINRYKGAFKMSELWAVPVAMPEDA